MHLKKKNAKNKIVKTPFKCNGVLLYKNLILVNVQIDLLIHFFLIEYKKCRTEAIT